MTNKTPTLKTRIKHKIGTSAEWRTAAENSQFTPLLGELIIYKDEGQIPKIKIGDGETVVENLPFITDGYVYADSEGSEDGEIIEINADLLGGLEAEAYATKIYVAAAIAEAQLGNNNGNSENIDLSAYMLKTDTAVNSEKLEGHSFQEVLDAVKKLSSDPREDEESPELSSLPINADQLGGIAAEEYALKTDIIDPSQLSGVNKINFSNTLLALNWEGEGPYTQTISVEGVTGEDRPHVFLDLSEATADNVEELENGWAQVKYALSGENTITFYCIVEAPEVDLPIEGEVVIVTEPTHSNLVGE